MERLIKFSLGAFVGWLLVNVSGVIKIPIGQLSVFENLLVKITLFVGWAATVIFSIPVLFAAIKSFKLPNK